MNFHEFTTQVISEMRRRFPGYDIQVQEVPKLQGESYTGMAIHPSGGDIALTMDLEALFDRFRNDLYLGNPMKAIEREIKEAVAQMPQFDTEALTNYERMKEKLTLQLVPSAKNKDLLADIPHRNIEDMALAYRFDIGHNERTSYSILVTNKMLNAYGISAAQLHDDALEAASHSCPATLRNMNEVIHNMAGQTDPSPMWVQASRTVRTARVLFSIRIFWTTQQKRWAAASTFSPPLSTRFCFLPMTPVRHSAS